MPTQQEIKRKRLAKRIAFRLFTDGTKRRATRLVMEFNGRTDGTGYCEDAVADLIERSLRSVTIFLGSRR